MDPYGSVFQVVHKLQQPKEAEEVEPEHLEADLRRYESLAPEARREPPAPSAARPWTCSTRSSRSSSRAFR